MSRFGFLQCEWPASAFVGANLFQRASPGSARWREPAPEIRTAG